MSSIYNLIYSALQYGDVEYVRQLETNVLLNWQDCFDDTRSSALALAAIYGHLSCCEDILKRCPSLLYKASKLGNTALHQAAFNGRQDVLKFLLHASASVTREECRDMSITTPDNISNKLLAMVTKDTHWTALHFAVEPSCPAPGKDHLRLAKLLLEADPSNNLLRMVDQNGDTAMHIAVRTHRLDIVKLLVETDPNFEYCVNVMSQTPLFIAFQDGLTGDETAVEIRKLLIEKQPSQCKVPTGKSKWTLLHHAAYKGDLSTIEGIIKFCPECLENVDIDNQNFLHIAVKFNHIDAVTNILQLSTITDKILNGQDNRGNTPFHIAAIEKNEMIVSLFLYNSRVSKTIRNMQGERAIDMSSIYNLIYSALQYGDVEYVRQLETNVLLNWQDCFDDTRSSALTLAAIYGHLSCCEDILKRCPSLLYKASKLGNTALHQAAFNGRQDVLKFLLHASASVTREECRDISITTPDNISNKLLAMVTKDTHWTALHFAVEPSCPAPGKDHLRLAKLLLEADPSNNLLRMVDQNGDTSMHIAVRTHRLDIVKLLVETDPNFEYCVNVMSQTPLFIAFQDGLTGDETAVEIRKLLIEKQPSQCKVPTGKSKWTLLHHAAYKGDLSTIEGIIKFCPECLENVDIDNQNFLHIAVKFNHIDAVTNILQLSTITDKILNGQDNRGNTPFHIAAIEKNEMIVSLFLYNSRVSKTIRNMQGERAIDMSSIYNLIYSALQYGDVEYVRQLETNVLLNWQDCFDDTRSSALTLAAIYGHLSCCEDILKRCPSLLYKASKLGNTALHQAAFNGRQDVLKFLLHASASVTREECRDISITTPDNISNKLLAMVTKDTHWTALHFAVEPSCPAPGKDHLRLAKLLLEADPSNNLLRMVDQNGDTSMHIAVRTHRLDIVKLLVETDPNFEYCVNVMSQTPLFIAFQDGLTGDETAVEIRKLLIEKQPSQCKVPTGKSKWTLLHHAAYKGDLSTIEGIIKFCPECLENVDIDNQNFLHIAVKFNHIDAVTNILQLSTITDKILNGQDNRGNTPFHIAAIEKNEMIVSLFLYNSRVSKTIRNMQGERAIDMSSIYNLIYSALQYGDVEYVRQLETNVLLNWQDCFDDTRSSALTLAAIYGHLSCCEDILKRCPSLLYKASKLGNTALHQAAFNGRQDVLKFLLHASASVTREECRDISITTPDNISNKLLAMVTKDTHWTALHFAVEPSCPAPGKDHLRLAKLLLEADPSNNLLRMVDQNGDTALHIAVRTHRLDIVKLLVETDPNFEYCVNVMSQTPLFIAFQDGLTGDETAVEIRKLLIEKQPSQCKVPIGTNNWTLLHHAAYKGDLSTIEDIIKFCPECLEIVDIDNQNFLHIAVMYKHIDVVTYILELSTITDEVLNGQDNHGNTPLHIAATGQNTKLTECFLYNSRVCKTIMNMQGLRAIDMIHFEYDKWKAGVYGLINRLGEKEIKDQTEFDLLVGALIATVSFAAGIAVPGCYNNDGPNKGTAILAGKNSFKVFVISNTIALLLSLYGVFSHFCLKYLHKKADVIFQLKMARYCSFGAIFAMVITFIAGSYAVLAVTEEFSIIVSALCCCFFGFAFYALWRIIMQDKPSFPRV